MTNPILALLLAGQANTLPPRPPPRPAAAPGAPVPPPAPAAPPAGVTVPPPAGATPPPPGEGLPGDIPPDESAPKPKINIESTFPKVTLLKFIGIAFLMMAAVMAMVMNHFLMTAEPLLNLGLGLGLLGAAILFGLIAFFNEDWRKWMSYLSTFALIGGVAARPIVTPLVTYDFGTVIPAALFAFAFFMYFEYLDAYQRFTDVGRMAVERNLSSFNLNQVINHFMTFGGMLAAVFMASAILIMTVITQLFAGAMGEEVARSVEMQAVFGQAMVITVIFTIVAVVLAFLFLFLDRRTEVEQVAYSREQIRDMVQKGGAPGQPAGPQGPSAPGGRPGGGTPPGAPRGSAPGFIQQK